MATATAPRADAASAAVSSWLIGLLAALGWAVCAWFDTPHRVVSVTASPTEFSAVRAERILARLLGAERPHPVSSDENAVVRSRLLQEFAQLGVQAKTYRAFACEVRRTFALISCATVSDVIADVLPGQGKAILMMAHYDSVASGPGASDDMSGVASVLEAARALRASHEGAVHPVMALITDGEEAGLIGAYAFLQNPDFRERIGAVVNVDARGTRGPSLLFQTSSGDGRLIDLYARSVAAPDTSSLYAEIYRRLPNDTDLTPFLQAGLPGFNLAFIGNVHAYHSPLDQRRSLSPATLQMHGDNLLGITRGLLQASYPSLKGADAVYLSVLNRMLVRMPASWALPLAIIGWLAVLLACRLAQVRWSKEGLRSLLIPCGLIVACLAAGFVLSLISRTLAGVPDPSYAYPLATRVSLALAVWSVALLLSRRSHVVDATAGAWVFLATLAVVSAALLRGVAPYFLFPTLIAAAALLAASLSRGGWSGAWGLGARVLGALAALLVWAGLMVSGEAVMGIRLHPLFTVPAALALTGLLPLMQTSALTRAAWLASVGLSAAGALIAAVIAGVLPSYSATAAQRLNLLYVEDHNSAHWIAASSPYDGGIPPLPASLARAAGFRLQTLNNSVIGVTRAYLADAGSARFTPPHAELLSGSGKMAASSSAGLSTQSAVVSLHGSDRADAMALFLPGAMRLQSIELGGQHLRAPLDWRQDTWLMCLSRDCRQQQVSLSWAGRPPKLEFAEQRYGLPAFGAFLEHARTSKAMPSQAGDQIMLIGELPLGAPPQPDSAR